MWVIVPAREDLLIGWCGLRPIQTPGQPELRYGLAEAARGLGFADIARRGPLAFASSAALLFDELSEYLHRTLGLRGPWMTVV